MKTIVIISAICVCVGALTLEELQIGIRATLPVCKIESNIDQQKENDFRDGIVDVEDDKVQLYSKCLMKKFNAYDDDGNLNEVVVREIAGLYLDENEINKLIAECSAISDANINIKSSKLIQCFSKYKTLKEMINV
ncbi:uncharacterized protein LOC122713896 [Apis laboriosa]|uniref:uncharacterized protein LOC122713896 n=1 Tax=Apis laboriosa TaxID=183418 RepID=UPI001CC6971D|nr:uncharacterized protein LOC122713896 [Apis laboriosa]